MFHSCTKIIASDLDIDEAFKSMHQSIMAKINNYTCECYIAIDTVTKHNIKIFKSQYKEKKMGIISNLYKLNLCFR